MNLVNSLIMTNWEKDVNYPYVVDKVLQKLKNFVSRFKNYYKVKFLREYL